MNRRWWWVLAVVLLAACASVPGGVEVSRDQLQAALDKRFPLERRILEIIDVRADGPQLALLPAGNRLGVELSLTATDRMSRIPLRGRAAMSFVPRFEPSDHTVRLSQVRIDHLELPGASPSWRGQLERVGAAFGELALEGAVLHAFTPEQVARLQGRTLRDIRVTSTGVRIDFTQP